MCVGQKKNAALVGLGLVLAGAVGAALGNDVSRKRIVESFAKLKQAKIKWPSFKRASKQ